MTAFLLDHAGAYGVTAADVGGLRVAASRSDGTVTHVVLQQRVGGLPVEGGDVVANLTADGRLLSVFGAPRAGVQAPSATARVSAAEALRAARDGGAPGRGERAQLVLAGDGAGRLAWRVTAAARGGAVDALVDAATGQVLQRRRLAHDVVRVDAKVFDQYPGAARGGTQRQVDITQYVTAPGQVKLFGPFAYVISDLNDDLTVQANEEVPPSSADDYLYTFQSFGSLPGMNCPAAPFGCSWNPGAASSWQTNRLQAGTQAFWYANRFHDHLSAAPISFTKAKGAFEGNDRVWVTVDTGASVAGGLPPSYDVNNAFMQVFPTGPPLMTLELFEPVTGNAWPAVNGADDASIVYHEYTHGMSGKLIVDSSGAEALDGAQANAMNEAWSDWFAMDDLVLDGYVADTAANGEVVVAPYVDRGRHEWRFQALDCPVGASAPTCPGGTSTGPGGFTYGDLGHVFDVAEPHSDGEIWAETLWDLRTRLITAHDAAEGVRRAELLVTRGMELGPENPTFLDQRNAILQADTVYNGGADRNLVWQVFAARGMGWYASTTGVDDTRPVESFALPPAPGSPTGTVRGTVRTELGGAAAGVSVVLGGHGSGFADDLRATTDASGAFTIAGVPVGTYPQLVAGGLPGFDAGLATGVTVSAGAATTRDLTLARDWAAAGGGATVAAFDGEDWTSVGCGPDRLIDGTVGHKWVTSSPAYSGDPGPESVTVRLPQAVDLRAVGIDPTSGCGEGWTAGLGGWKLETSTDGTTFTQTAAGTFTKNDSGHQVLITPGAGKTGVRYVRLTGLSTLRTNAGDSGARFLVVSELEVYGSTPAGSGLAISGVSPASGITGAKVNLDGSGFTSASVVKLGGLKAKAKLVSSTRLQVTVPNGATTGRFTVTDGGSTATAPADFTVTLSVTGFTPKSGPPGTVVTISGVGFSSASAVAFGSKAASFTVVSPTSIRATVPAGATAGKIKVTAAAGSVTSAKKFSPG